MSAIIQSLEKKRSEQNKKKMKTEKKKEKPKREGLLFEMPDTTLKISNQIEFSHVAWYTDTGK